MGCPLRKAVLILAIIAFLSGGPSAEAGNPIGDFFKRLGNSITKPRSSPPPRRSPQKSATAKKKDGTRETAPQEMPSAAPTVSPGPAPMLTPMPLPLMVRSATGVPPTKRRRQDLPYGIPVPNKAGFVTSPYAPRSGYVDVRGFPSGTEVKDPYSGKIFLTP